MKLVCPADRAPLMEDPDGLTCSRCGRRYPVRDGVVDCFRPDLIRHPIARAVTEQAIAHYDETAAQYAGAGAAIPPDHPIVRGLLAALRPAPAPRVIVDLGCGTGSYFEHYRDAETVLGLDATPHMLTAAHGPAEWLRKRGVVVRLVRSACEPTPIPDGVAGLVVAIGVLGYHLPLTVDALTEIRRILAPGGRLYLETHTVTPRTPLQKITHLVKFGLITRLPAPLRRLPRSYLSQHCAEPETVRRVASQAGLRVIKSDRTAEKVWQNRPLVLSLLERPR